MKNNYSAIIFDLDGVIIDTAPVWRESAIILLKRKSRVYQPQTKSLLKGKSLKEVSAFYKEFYNLSETPEEIYQERTEIVKNLLSKEVKVFPEFYDLIAIVDKYFNKKAVATNSSSEVLEIIIKSTNLDKYFGKNIFSSSLVEKGKPKPDLYLYAATAIGVAPSNCIAIEDSKPGLESARSAGMFTIGLTNSTTIDELGKANTYANSLKDINLKEILVND